MARPRSIDEQEILHAARAVFLERGISGTTAEVAERAGVSEGSIFNRFGSKRALFLQAMKPNPDCLPWLLELPGRVGQGTLRTQLEEIGAQGIAFFRGLMPLMMMLMSNPGEDAPASPTEVPGDAPLRALERMRAYLAAEQAQGRIRADVDTEVLARMLLAGAQQYAFLELLLERHGQTPMPSDVYVRGLVDLLLRGAAPVEQEEDGR